MRQNSDSDSDSDFDSGFVTNPYESNSAKLISSIINAISDVKK